MMRRSFISAIILFGLGINILGVVDFFAAQSHEISSIEMNVAAPSHHENAPSDSSDRDCDDPCHLGQCHFGHCTHALIGDSESFSITDDSLLLAKSVIPYSGPYLDGIKRPPIA